MPLKHIFSPADETVLKHSKEGVITQLREILKGVVMDFEMISFVALVLASFSLGIFALTMALAAIRYAIFRLFHCDAKGESHPLASYPTIAPHC